MSAKKVHRPGEYKRRVRAVAWLLTGIVQRQLRLRADNYDNCREGGAMAIQVSNCHEGERWPRGQRWCDGEEHVSQVLLYLLRVHGRGGAMLVQNVVVRVVVARCARA